MAEKIENMNAGSEADCECPFYIRAAAVKEIFVIEKNSQNITEGLVMF